MIRKLLLFVSIIVTGCIGIPENVTPVTKFDINRYLGTWYEIARLDHSFERGLQKVTANYSIRDDGGIKVVNRGYDPQKDEWKESIGRAYFVEDPEIGRLKVSFFGPFYGAYNIIELDKDNYSYSMVCGPNKSYLWILAREPNLAESQKSKLTEKAGALGFKIDELIYVKH